VATISRRQFTCSLVAAGAAMACQPRRIVMPAAEASPRSIAELWVDPGPNRDLFHGVGGPRLAPDPDVPYRVVEVKVGGFSDGYTVVGPGEREWSAKFPPEAAPEIVASRILWGIGYHQPPVYLLREWRAEGADRPNPQLPARFREKSPDLRGLDSTGAWSYYEHPLVGTPQLSGLLVLQAMLGNSDLKDSNNTVYELDAPLEGASRWYVARDVGHSFGRTGMLDAPRGDVDVFEATPFIREVSGDHVVLHYGGRHRELFEQITRADVRWICTRLSRLSDRQWADAFRAGGYEPGIADRFIRRMQSKIDEGLSATG
jgi:hypothetical protein